MYDKSRTEQASTVSKRWVSVSFSLPIWGTISPFPHGTSALSVRAKWLGLEGGPPIFEQNACIALLNPSLSALVSQR